jgi:hypothetical protein
MDYCKVQMKLPSEAKEISLNTQHSERTKVAKNRLWMRCLPDAVLCSVLLSNVYLHNVLDLWFERVVRTRLRGSVVRVQDALRKRLGKFGLTLEAKRMQAM